MKPGELEMELDEHYRILQTGRYETGMSRSDVLDEITRLQLEYKTYTGNYYKSELPKIITSA